MELILPIGVCDGSYPINKDAICNVLVVNISDISPMNEEPSF